MVVAAIGYLIAGFTKSPWISLGLGLVLVAAAAVVMHKVSGSKAVKLAEE